MVLSTMTSSSPRDISFSAFFVSITGNGHDKPVASTVFFIEQQSPFLLVQLLHPRFRREVQASPTPQALAPQHLQEHSPEGHLTSGDQKVSLQCQRVRLVRFRQSPPGSYGCAALLP